MNHTAVRPATRWMPWLLPAMALLLYFNTLPYGFVFDTEPNINRITAYSLSQAVQSLLKTGRPVGDLSLMLNRAFDTDNPVGYRLVNILIHAATAMLLFGLVQRTLALPRLRFSSQRARPWVALALAGLWMLHPLTTSAVTYVIQRYESLMALFYVLTLYAVLRAATSVRPMGWSLLAVLACGMGMGSKQVMFSAPLAALLFDRAFITGSLGGAWRRRWGLYLALAGTWSILAWSNARGLVGGAGSSAGFGFEPISPTRYFLSQGEVILYYLKLCAIPFPLVLDYGWIPAYPERADLWVPGFVVVGLLALASVWGLIRNTGWGYLGAIFFLVLGPTSSFMPIADLAFEHRMYLPLMAVMTLVMVGGWRGLTQITHGPTSAVVGSVVVLGLASWYGMRTFEQNLTYENPVAVWSNVVKHRPFNARGWQNLGSAYFKLEYNDQAMACWRRVLEIKPGHAAAEDGLASVFLRRGRPDLALPHFNRAVERQPEDAQFHYNRGEALLALGRVDQAKGDYEKAIALNPDYAKAYNNLGLASLRLGQRSQAIAHFRRALELDPKEVDPYRNLAKALADQGDWRGAVLACRDGLALESEHRVLLTQLARLLATSPDPAIRQGRGDEALQLAQRADELSQGSDVIVLDTLAAALANVGRYEQAARVSRQAQQLATQAKAPPEVIAQIAHRTARYAQGQPFRQATPVDAAPVLP